MAKRSALTWNSLSFVPKLVVVLANPNPATAPFASIFTVYWPSRLVMSPVFCAVAEYASSIVTALPEPVSFTSLSLAVSPLTVLAAAAADPLALEAEVAALLANVDASAALVVAVFA
jgi:hypothetical protein